MARASRTRTGSMLVTGSSIILILLIIIGIAGFRYSFQIAFKEEDLKGPDGDRSYFLELDAAMISFITISVEANSTIEYTIEISDPTGDNVYFSEGSGSHLDQLRLDTSGAHELRFTFDSPLGTIEDIELEIGMTGMVLVGSCGILSLLFTSYIIMISTGCVLVLMGYIGRKKEGRRRHSP